MNATAFTEFSFLLLVAFSIVIPCGIYGVLMLKRSIAISTVLVFGLAMVAMSGVDVFLLQTLESVAKTSPSLADDVVFASELRLALYLLPALFGGIGINMVSHVLVRHLSRAERRFLDEHPDG